MQIFINPAPAEWPRLCERNTPADDDIAAAVADIVATVRRDGDEALRHYAQLFDGNAPDALELSDEEKRAAAASVAGPVKRAIAEAARNIGLFHTAQRPRLVESRPAEGVHCLQRAVPIERVGLYIPGGNAPLFSTVLMLALPARIAGCREIVLCTPQRHDGHIAPEIVYAAQVCGVDRIFRIGGAQAVAAMTYGTASVPRVHKIFGPGNRYVTKAKQLVSRHVAIDMPAGPSEVLVMADATARPDFVAADLLSQAEHGADSQAMLVCDTEEMARNVMQETERQAARLGRTGDITRSLAHSRIIVLPSRRDMTAFANAYAAEHLIIATDRPWEVADGITAAGSVFIGHFSPESAGDYASGTNHTLPTGGWARSCSGVNIDSFVRKITYQELTREGLDALADTIVAMAEAEGLDAHAAAVKIRTGRT